MNRILKKHSFKYLLTIILSILTSFLFSVFAIRLGKVIDVVVNKNSSLKDKILSCILIIFLWFVLSSIFSYVKSKYASDVIKDLKMHLYNSIGKKEISDYMSVSNEYYLNNLTKNIDFYNDNYLGPKCDIVSNIISAIVSVGTIFFINWKLGLSFVAVTLVTIILSQLPGVIMAKKTVKFSERNADNLKLINNNLSGFEQIKLLNLFNIFQNIFKKKDNDFENVRLEYMFASRFANTLGIFFSFFAQLACMSIGIWFVLCGDLTVGLLISSINLLNGVFSPVQEFAQNKNLMGTVKDIVKNFEDIMSTDNEESLGVMLNDNVNSISVKNLSMDFKDKHIFDNYNVNFECNKKYAIVGESGRGKSTLVKLIMKYYPSSSYSGEVLINETNINKIDTESLFNKIAYIQRNDFYVDGTIKDNIELYRNLNIQQNLYNQLKFTEEFLNKNIEDGSRNLVSTGEKQRIDILRFLVKDYDVLIFDEPTSNLDRETSKIIFDLIFKISNKIVIVITHTSNEETLNKFDEVIRL